MSTPGEALDPRDQLLQELGATYTRKSGTIGCRYCMSPLEPGEGTMPCDPLCIGRRVRSLATEQQRAGSDDLLVRVCAQVLAIPTLAPGESLAEPIDDAVVAAVLGMKAELDAFRAAAWHIMRTAREIAHARTSTCRHDGSPGIPHSRNCDAMTEVAEAALVAATPPGELRPAREVAEDCAKLWGRHAAPEFQAQLVDALTMVIEADRALTRSRSK